MTDRRGRATSTAAAAATGAAQEQGSGAADRSRDSRRTDQLDEAGQLPSMPGVPTGPAMTSAQARGFVGGSLVFGAVGALLFAPLGFVEWVDMPLAVRLLVFAIVGALAGGTAGAVFWGSRLPEVEGESPDTGDDAHGTDGHADERQR